MSTGPPSDSRLRRRAEDALRKTRSDIQNMAIEDTQELVHELQVHQIELQMQNEELQKTQQELEISREKYYDIYNRAPVGYLMLDREGTILEANLMAAQLLECPTSELKGRKFSSFVKPQFQDTYYMHYRSTFLTGIQRTCEVELVSKNRLFVQLNSLAVPGQGSCRISISNITTAKNLESDLVQMNEKEQAASIAKSEFLANMSHEIRNPMNVIVGISSILERSEPLTQQQKKLVHTLQKSSDILMNLVGDLLSISKVESRTVALEEVSFNIPALFAEITDLFEMQAREKNLDFSFRNDCSFENVIGDSRRLRQIVMNLCQNAIKFTSKGRIAITLCDADSLKKPCRNLIITVEDTGIGIEQEKRNAIFEKFIRANSSISHRYEGAGLGLAIVKELTEKMGGTIAVESEVGAGSVFTVIIPFLEDKAAPSDSPALQKNQPPKPLSEAPILLVEDREDNIMVATSLLDELGYEYDVAINGSLALEQFLAHPHSVILMDLQMPEMDGYEATRRIRMLEKEKNLEPTPILAMTGNATEDDKFLCMKAGMNDFLSKPFRLNDLKDKLQILQNKKAA